MLDKLQKWEKAPQKGQALIYTRKQVIFESYDSKESLIEKLGNEEILEIHLFDKNKEYRCIVSRSKRRKNGVIEAVIDFPVENPEKYYEEKILLENGKGELIVYNSIKYDDEEMDESKSDSDKTGMATIDNYRLVMG